MLLYLSTVTRLRMFSDMKGIHTGRSTFFKGKIDRKCLTFFSLLLPWRGFSGKNLENNPINIQLASSNLIFLLKKKRFY
jgi:hypothetical protein